MSGISLPRLIIAGTGAGVGKSILMTGLAVALRKRGVGLSCCVSGPRLLQSIVFHRISRRYVRSLDLRLLSKSNLVSTINQAALGADLLLIDGRAGYFDGQPIGSTRSSDFEISQITGTPVVLVADVRNVGPSIAPIAKGFESFLPGVQIAGVIANRIEAESGITGRSYQALLKSHKLPPLLGALASLALSGDLPREDISQLENRTALPMQLLIELGNAVAEQVDIDGLLSVAQSAAPLSGEQALVPLNRRVRIAVTDDSCFSLCFQDNLDIMRILGAELVPFSPLADTELPPRIGGVYITGAYLGPYAEELAQNSSIKGALTNFVKDGGVLYSEGAGTAYLCREMRANSDGELLPGVGIIPGTAVPVMNGSSYIEAVTAEESIFGRGGQIVRGISTGEWDIQGLDTYAGGQTVYSLRIANGSGETTNEGYSTTAQMLATFHFLHFGSNQTLAKNFVDAAQVVHGM